MCPDTDHQLSACILVPCSNTHCKLIGLCLALQFSTTQILSDSLTSLQLITRWASWPTSRTLQCPARVQLRRFLHLAASKSSPPLHEKFKAHDDAAISLALFVMQ